MLRETRPLVILAYVAVAAIGYALVRPLLAMVIDDLALVEFPLAFALLGAAALSAGRRARPMRARFVPWRRHEQIVRRVPDPDADQAAATLAAWIERGEHAETAAEILARASVEQTANLDHERKETRARVTDASTKSAREALVRDVLSRSSGDRQNRNGA